MLGSLPAKLADYGVFPTTHQVTVTDSLTSVDTVTKRRGLSVVDVSHVSERVAFGRGIGLRDGLHVSDRISRAAAKGLLDTCVAGDFLRKGRGVKVMDVVPASDQVSRRQALSVVDTFLAEFFTTRRRSAILSDAMTQIDALSKTVAKPVREELLIRDVARRVVIRPVRDEVTAGDAYRRQVIKRPVDKLTPFEIVAKVEFTLTGDRIPRAYFLPDKYRPLWDIIEEEYHNIKVNTCKRLYNVFQWVRRRVIGLKYPGALRDAVAVSDYVVRRVTIVRRDKLEYDFSHEKSR